MLSGGVKGRAGELVNEAPRRVRVVGEARVQVETVEGVKGDARRRASGRD